MMSRFLGLALMSLLFALRPAVSVGQVFEIREDFRDASEGSLLGERWHWLRENKSGWRFSKEGLQVLIEPGNMWGPANDAKNVLLYPLREDGNDAVQVSVQLTHLPKKRWEQADLVWYYSDSSMVKLGLEIEHGVTNIVMGREEHDRTQTIAIIPYADPLVQLRLQVSGQEIRGSFRNPTSPNWTLAGKTTLPDPESLSPQLSLQFYQGEDGSDRWATVHWIQWSSGAE
ncbi:beta-xylosidase family glycoside hydrolase [Allorhodopirellula solitaria]|uniref:Beta-xylosidase C-terminal Concanavalin A-like domain-containing protein n=1 Tax=Allorhodopirellula solitaria TaxID=2527987 RepID=A0A5C5YED8_9BACT|nr:hypothetical protein [Allorhodopirellula solitaria]TWT74117.1 hypothetical protein CA85_10030 [Allorhodopirellula solitaria]